MRSISCPKQPYDVSYRLHTFDFRKRQTDFQSRIDIIEAVNVNPLEKVKSKLAKTTINIAYGRHHGNHVQSKVAKAGKVHNLVNSEEQGVSATRKPQIQSLGTH